MLYSSEEELLVYSIFFLIERGCADEIQYGRTRIFKKYGIF